MKNHTKIVSLILSLVIVFSAFNIVPLSITAVEVDKMSLSATPDEVYPEIQLGETVAVTVENTDDISYLKFVPNRDMRITFYSTSDFDTIVDLYTESFDYYASDDDSGEGYNFRLNFDVKADTVYYFGVRLLGDSTGSFSVTLTENTAIWDYERDYRYGGIRITGYYGSETELEIPSFIDDIPVTSIGTAAFREQPLTGIIIPDGVEAIDSDAFYLCRNLEDITIPDSVTSIDVDAFRDTAWYDEQPEGVVYAGKVAYQYKGTCPAEVTLKDDTIGIGSSAFYNSTNLTSITIPDSVRAIGGAAFRYCANLFSIKLPDNLSIIGNSAFANTGLTDIKIPANVTEIENFAFADCYQLTEIMIPNSVRYIGENAFGYIDFNGDSPGGKVDGFTIYGYDESAAEDYANENGFTFVVLERPEYEYEIINGEVTITKYNGKAEELTIPSTIDGYPVTNIAFYGNSCLKSVIIPDGVTELDFNALADCPNLENITIPDTVVDIGLYAFASTPWLSNMLDSHPNEVIYAGKVAMYYYGECPSELVLKEGTVGIASGAFHHQNIESITLPDSLKSIGIGAFLGCSKLKSITIPYGVTSIEDQTFLWCSELVSINIPDSVTEIGQFVFEGCSNLKSIVIPGSVVTIVPLAFENCEGLESVVFSDSGSDIAIGSGAFYRCPNLKSVTIPKSVKTIDKYAFGYLVAGAPEGDMKVNGFTIYGYKDTAAESYAEEHGFTFVPLGDAPIQPKPIVGDADGDGQVTLMDATNVQYFISSMKTEASEEQMMYADIDKNGILEVIDATYIQRHVAGMEIPFTIGETY